MTESRQQAYTACLRYFAELRGLGVTDVVVSPGSRSTVLALSAAAAGLDITVHHDERVGAFHALGAARASRRPVVLVCTSGTAGANYHPAVIEAHHAGVPLVVCTSDRPPELRTWGAGQTVDQVALFGSSVRWFHETPVGDDITDDHARALALRSYDRAMVGAGPVHLNWPFREPLQPTAPLQAPDPTLTVAAAPRSSPSPRLLELAAAHERGLVVVGPADLSGGTAREIATFAAAVGWPVIADPASGMRTGGCAAGGSLVTTAELFLGAGDFAATLDAPEVVVRVGLSPTSKAYRLWLEVHPPQQLILVDPVADWSDPTGSVTEVIHGPVDGLFAVAPNERTSDWLRMWTDAEARTAAAATEFLASNSGEIGIVRRLLAQLAASDEPANLVVANSMPIRDVDFGLRPTAAPLRVIANRGANGIDGVIATALGVASQSEGHTYVLIGDVATLHDLGGLAAVGRMGPSITVIVIDNDAGGIFSILPVRQAIAAETFDQLFSTPHGTDLPAVGEAMGFAVTVVGDGDPVALPPAAGDRPNLVVVRTTVAAMTDGVAGLRAAVAEALR